MQDGKYSLFDIYVLDVVIVNSRIIWSFMSHMKQVTTFTPDFFGYFLVEFILSFTFLLVSFYSKDLSEC